jgi:hypothetical protein
MGCPPLLHAQSGELGFAVSRFAGTPPLPKLAGPIEIGSMQRQQISLMGLMNLPLQVTLPLAGMGISSIIISCKIAM